VTAREPHPGDLHPATRAQRLLKAGKSAEAGMLIDQMLPGLTGYDRAWMLVLRVVVFYNSRPADELSLAVDAAFNEVRGRPEPYLHGHLYALAALASHRRGALEQAVTYLVLSQRALRAIDTENEAASSGWFDLGMAYSYIGFHGYAITANQRALDIGAVAGVSLDTLAAPGVRLRGAVFHDHEGDTEKCIWILRDLVDELRRLSATGSMDRFRPTARLSWGYAAARLAAFGEKVEDDLRPYLAYEGRMSRPHDLAALGGVCVAIGQGRPIEALARLGGIGVAPESLGVAEVSRLTALAHVRAGDHRQAYEADRKAFRLASAHGEQLREVFVEGIAARLDHEDLRRRVARHAEEALTDALTSLPNRRHFQEYVTGMVERGEQAVVGVCDMDGFKLVNTVHGHLAGDMVLQRVGEIITRTLRRGDFLARYGGDEFVVVLPKTDLDEAADVARRIVDAVGRADWAAIVPGTPVAVSVGWAEVVGPRMDLQRALMEAFEAADRAMLDAKTHSRARAS
jgi:diguanylate cyclase (GGDEF)-like protein